MTLILSSGGINPSNNKKNGFPNLARRDRDDETVNAVSETTKAELIAAGIMPFDIYSVPNSEVPSRIVGSLHGWTFTRAWYYWIAKGPGIPCETAEILHAAHGNVVRVDGHCGCPSPTEWFKGFGVGHYHVDTQEGLNALAETIRYIALNQCNRKVYNANS